VATPTASQQVPADWYNKEGADLAQSLGAVFTTVRDENEWRTDKDDYHWGLYAGSGLGGVYTRSRRNMTYLNATLPDNVCKMATDTLTAKVATIRPIPLVFTQRGNWADARKARKMRQFGEGEFYRQKIHEEIGPRIIKDALVSRGGCVQVYVDGKRPKVERVCGWTIYHDDWDAESGEPLTCMRLRTMDRVVAKRKLGTTPEKAKAIEDAGRFSSPTSVTRDEDRSSTVDRVELVEAWYRCPDHDPDDKEHECTGRHVIICDGCVLFDEPWPHEFFPFAWLFYDTPNTGFFGSGLVETLEGYQVSINEANCKTQEMFDMSGKLIILRDGSGVFKSDITNGLRVAHCRPGPYAPEVVDLDMVNEHMNQRAPVLVERALNASGVSQMAAQSEKPAGVESGIALQTLDDVETQRHIVFGRRFETWCMNVMRLLFECVKKIAKEHGDYAIKVPLKGAYLDLSWKDVEVDGFQLHLQSVGNLYLSFAGKLEKLKTLFEMGAIDRGTFMRHLDAGDVQSELDLETADKLLVDEILESMMDVQSREEAEAKYVDPHEELPLAWAIRRTHQKKLQAQMDGAPMHVLDALKRFKDDCVHLEKKMLAKQQADAAAAAGPTPLGGGAPPPPTPPPPDGGIPLDPGMAAGAPGNMMPDGGMAPPIAA
jgi:hypothetical protein